MARDNLESRCKKAIITIADDVKDINYKLSHFLESYRSDYHKMLEEQNYKSLY